MQTHNPLSKLLDLNVLRWKETVDLTKQSEEYIIYFRNTFSFTFYYFFPLSCLAGHSFQQPSLAASLVSWEQLLFTTCIPVCVILIEHPHYNQCSWNEQVWDCTQLAFGKPRTLLVKQNTMGAWGGAWLTLGTQHPEAPLCILGSMKGFS